MAITVQVIVDPKLKKTIRELAKAEKRSLSNMAEQLLTEALHARQSKETAAA
jgi:hypothetical protein